MRVSVLRDRHSLKENLPWRSNCHAVVCSMLRIRTLISRTRVSGSYGGCQIGRRNLCHFPAGGGWSSMWTVPTSELCLSRRWPWMGRRWNLCKVETCRRKPVTWKCALGCLGCLHLRFLFTLCFARVDKIWWAQPTSCSSHRPVPPCCTCLPRMGSICLKPQAQRCFLSCLAQECLPHKNVTRTG